MINNDGLLVTIGIPTYNSANRFLRSTIECVLQQTYQNIEVIVSDNASTDNTEEVVRSYSDSRIRYFKQPKNIGPIANINYCIQQATGTYYLILHDDDLIDSDFIETCVNEIGDRTDVGMIMTGGRIIDNNNNIIGEKENITQGFSTADFFLAWYEGKILMLHCSILFNTKALREVGGLDEKYYYLSDVATQFTVAARMGRIDIRDIKASWRDHPNTLGKSGAISKWCDNSLDLVDLVCNLVDEKKDMLRRIAMNRSANRMYRYASTYELRISRIKAFYTIWKKFGIKYVPPKMYHNSIIPGLRYIYSPIKSVKRYINSVFTRLHKAFLS